MNMHIPTMLAAAALIACGPLSLSSSGVEASATAISRGATAHAGVPEGGPVSGAEGAPEGLTASEWSGIRGAYEAGRHAVVPVENGGHRARNPGQGWTTEFDGRGFTVTPEGGSWSWGLELVSYGVEGSEQVMASAPLCVDAAGSGLSYRWDGTVTEWFKNDGRGLEHGFTVHARPADCEGALTLTMAVRGGLSPEVTGDGRDVRFVGGAGAAVVNYSGLTVFDASEKSVPARFEPAPGGLRLTVEDGGARYPLTIDPIVQQSLLRASNAGRLDQFGTAVATSWNTLIVGAPYEDSRATGVNGDQYSDGRVDSGAAYIFVRGDGGAWNQQAYVKASNTDRVDLFGSAVGVCGDVVVVGAPAEDSAARVVDGKQSDNSASGAGAAYVFVRDENGAWSQRAYLKGSNADALDRFGCSVAVWDNTVVVGAYGEDNSATGVNSDQGSNSSTNSGAAYVFVRDASGQWSQRSYLKASNTDAGDEFGRSVAISGDVMVIGAPAEDSGATGVNGDQSDNSAGGAGAAYVFARDENGVWSQQAYLKASNTGAMDQFGWSVAISGDRVVVGAPGEDSAARSIEGDQSDDSASAAGAAYVFVRDENGNWTQEVYLKASNADPEDVFGRSVAVWGATVLVGAPYEDSVAHGIDGLQGNNHAYGAGAAYVFVSDQQGRWSQQAYVKASNTGPLDEFGGSVGVTDGTAVIGARREDGAFKDTGAAYVFAGLGVPACPDLDGDGDLDTDDLNIFLSVFGCTGADCPGDFDRDGAVDTTDLNILLSAFGSTC